MMLQVQRLPLSRQVSYNRVEEMEDELRVLKQENVGRNFFYPLFLQVIPEKYPSLHQESHHLDNHKE